MIFFISVHDYTLCFISSTCYSVSYYNYNSIWTYYIVIHFTDNLLIMYSEGLMKTAVFLREV